MLLFFGILTSFAGTHGWIALLAIVMTSAILVTAHPALAAADKASFPLLLASAVHVLHLYVLFFLHVLMDPVVNTGDFFLIIDMSVFSLGQLHDLLVDQSHLAYQWQTLPFILHRNVASLRVHLVGPLLRSDLLLGLGDGLGLLLQLLQLLGRLWIALGLHFKLLLLQFELCLCFLLALFFLSLLSFGLLFLLAVSLFFL